ncbi:zinc-binding dehydrogenase [Pseudomonas rossensis]|uniref:zinc-binding dehydrogenase n=1 Tax=Pseudomonas rossensis TaxID=2305471 RepID=UPI0032609821
MALGAQVTVFDITEDKRQDALRLGAIKYVNVSRPAELQGLNNSLNMIINTIPSGHDPLVYLKMIRLGGEMAVLGLPPTAETPKISTSALPNVPLVKVYVYGSNTGSVSQIQAMMDYSVEHGIYPDVEVIPVRCSDLHS